MPAMNRNEIHIDRVTRIIHMGLLIFGVLAWLTGDWAEDFEKGGHLGFTIHSWLGIGLSVSVLLRIIYGIVGPANVRFSKWVPYNRERLVAVREDIIGLLHFRLPDRPTHAGLSGLVQSFGLLLFSWMAATGSAMFFLIEPGTKTGGLVEVLKEVHEVGDVLIPVYLTLHVGAVVLHSLAGDAIWRRMFSGKP